MDNPNPDEIAFFLFALTVTLIWAIRYVYRLDAIPTLRPRVGRRFLLAGLPLTCSAGIFGVLRTWADAQVRGDAFYLALFLLGEGVWLAFTQWTLRPLGIDLAADVLERANPSALVVFAGAMLATTLVYAGGNIGTGPTIWTTLVPAAVATMGLGVLWVMLWTAGGTLDAILIDRDTASGLRAAATLVAGGLVLGRAAAGRFTDWGETFRTLATGAAPALLIAVVAAGVQRALAPTATRPRPSVFACGLLPALALLSLGVLVVVCRPFPLDPSRW